MHEYTCCKDTGKHSGVLLCIGATVPLYYQKPRVKFCHLLERFPQHCLLTATSAYELPLFPHRSKKMMLVQFLHENSVEFAIQKVILNSGFSKQETLQCSPFITISYIIRQTSILMQHLICCDFLQLLSPSSTLLKAVGRT